MQERSAYEAYLHNKLVRIFSLGVYLRAVELEKSTITLKNRYGRGKDMAEIPLKRLKYSMQPTNLIHFHFGRGQKSQQRNAVLLVW